MGEGRAVFEWDRNAPERRSGPFLDNRSEPERCSGRFKTTRLMVKVDYQENH